MRDTEKNIQELIIKAKEVSLQAYAPYSNFRVGAALLTASGKIYTGCNVEFSDYLALHAELNAIGAAVKNGERNFDSILIYSYCSPPVLPCGSCRQKLFEFSQLNKKDIKIIVVNDKGEKSKYLLSELLPSGNIPVEK
ncbi:MAG: cytidine deaminase [Candidatus Heimdallarchaeum endolithica]|uniref:cytidine deaminase n=1 Tax=Candidatus Heimdallarchaeum endolithica TaxID=2876572 RepID=A0A9Y1BP79_9ARCH|nr:MAG: cytidine deaminase [Candidatus Heimdallarchaeum endolithica]